MIKVNLLRSRIQDQQATVMGNVQEVDEGELKPTLIKVAFILLFTLGLMIYESQNIRSLNEQIQRMKAQTQDLEAKSAAKALEAAGVKDIAERARELEDKLKIMKLLSRLRLREVKTLDFMQSSIPEKVWLKSIRYDSDQTDPAKAQYTFTGNSVTTDDLSEFVKRLEESNYLGEVIVIKNQEVTLSAKNATVRDFLFTAEVEVSN